jgi:hypothetical protein
MATGAISNLDYEIVSREIQRVVELQVIPLLIYYVYVSYSELKDDLIRFWVHRDTHYSAAETPVALYKASKYLPANVSLEDPIAVQRTRYMEELLSFESRRHCWTPTVNPREL